MDEYQFKLVVVGSLALSVGWLAATQLSSRPEPAVMRYDYPKPLVDAQAVRDVCSITLRANKEFSEPLVIATGSVKMDKGQVIWQSFYQVPSSSAPRSFTGLYSAPNICEVITVN